MARIGLGMMRLLSLSPSGLEGFYDRILTVRKDGDDT